MKNFSFPRFAKLLRAEFHEKPKYYFSETLSAALGYTLINIITLWKSYQFGFRHPEESIVGELEALGGLYFLGTYLAIHIFASRLFNNLSTKQSRVRYLMIPATNLEKYLSRLTFVTIGAFLILAIGILSADLLRLLLNPLFPHSCGSVLPVLSRSFSFAWNDLVTVGRSTHYSGMYGWWIIHFTVALFAWIYTSYFVGSCLFRKWVFVKTSISLIVLLILATWLFGSITPNNGIIVKNDLVKVGALFFSFLTLLNFWLSYRLFNRLQVIPRKLI